MCRSFRMYAWTFLVVAALSLPWPACVQSSHASAAPASDHAPPKLTAVARRTLEYYFETDRLKRGSLAKLIKEFPSYNSGNTGNNRNGLFVTLSYAGKSRACWGSLTPEHGDLIASTVYATVGALTREYRFTPIKADEVKKLKVQVTVVRSLEPIHRITEQNPMVDGLLVRSGGKSGVLLPGEASDAYYQLVQCKLKAGIKPGEPCQLYRIRADVYQ